MSVPIKLRGDFSADDVRAVARRCKDGAQVRRLLTIATILDGRGRSDAALVGGVTRQIVRDWIGGAGPGRQRQRVVQVHRWPGESPPCDVDHPDSALSGLRLLPLHGVAASSWRSREAKLYAPVRPRCLWTITQRTTPGRTRLT